MAAMDWDVRMPAVRTSTKVPAATIPGYWE